MTAKLKSYNRQAVYIGAPGSGKSYAARHHAWAEAQRVDAFVVVHDPTGSWEEERSIPSRRYRSTGELARGLKEQGSRIAHVLDVTDADDALRAGIGLAGVSMRAAKGGQYHPVIVVVDEAVTAGGVRSHGMEPLWMDAIARRRHLGVGIYITAQSAFFAHRSVLTLATEIHVFRIADPADAKRLVAVGLDERLASRLRELPDRQYITISSGRVTGFNGRPFTERRTHASDEPQRALPAPRRARSAR